MEEENSRLPEGAEKWNAVSFNKEFGHLYESVTEEEKVHYRQVVSEHWETLCPTHHKVLKAAHDDIRATLSHVNNVVQRLEQRTGQMTSFFSHKGDNESYARPQYYVPTQMEPFFDTILKTCPAQLAARMEAFPVSGVEGKLN
ncbi:hypothetical protein FRC02_002729 [Tulasnella sp. 418]|nr:hypothetical protein FRC02_002729 [Tulasnella sp. 418]